MKKFKHLSVVVISFLCFMGFIGLNCLTPARAEAAAEKKAVKKAVVVKKKEPASVVMAAPSVATLGKKVSVILMGSGFEPEKEIRILFTDAEGMQTDIGYALTPEPKANKAGAFSTTWECDEFIKANLVTAGVFTLTATDAQFNPLAMTPITFAAAKAKTDDKAKDDKGKDDKSKGDGDKEKKKKE